MIRPKWAIARGISQADWEVYARAMQKKYGWRTSLFVNDPYYYTQFNKPSNYTWKAETPEWRAKNPSAVETPTTPATPTTAPSTVGKQGWTFEKNFMGSGQDAFVLKDDTGMIVDFQLVQAKSNVQSLPVQARWQLQELARTQKAVGGANPYWSPLEQSIQERLSRQGIHDQLVELGRPDEGWDESQGITEEDIAMLDRARQSEILGKFQMSDIAERKDAERNYRIREFDQDKNRILAGLPSGVEGDVARYFVNKLPNAWRENSPAEITARQSATGIAERTRGVSAPGWLPEFVPGTEAGKPIGWGQAFQNGQIQAGGMPFVPTPSGQQLTRMSPSQARWLSGAINVYGGRSWEDILGEAESMQPVTPRGAGQRRWNPSRQV